MPSQPPAYPVPANQAELSKKSGLAIGSLVCGITSLFTLILTGIPAIICGHMALGRIKRSQGSIGGRCMAIAGLVMGYISIVLTLLFIPLAALATPVILKTQKKAELVQNTNHAKQMFMILIEHDQNRGAYPESLDQLVTEKLITTQRWNELQPMKGGQWQYFQPPPNDYSSERIILVSPKTIDGNWVVLCANGAVHQMPDAKYQRLRAQQNP